MSRALAAAAAVVLVLAVAGCSDGSRPATASKASRRCHPTTAQARAPFIARGFDYGNSSLGTALWPGGRLVAGPLPGGGSYADVKPDGSIEAKLGWWRAANGRLTIAGERLDRTAPPLRADIPDGYGDSGFQVSRVVFPTAGCWRIVGRVGRASLTFDVQVVTG